MAQKAISSWFLGTLLAMTVGVLLLTARPVRAQVDAGSILGTVTDATGAVIHGATVTLTNRSEEHTSELQSRSDLVCRLLLEKKKKKSEFNLIAVVCSNCYVS